MPPPRYTVPATFHGQVQIYDTLRGTDDIDCTTTDRSAASSSSVLSCLLAQSRA